MPPYSESSRRRSLQTPNPKAVIKCKIPATLEIRVRSALEVRLRKELLVGSKGRRALRDGLRVPGEDYGIIMLPVGLLPQKVLGSLLA